MIRVTMPLHLRRLAKVDGEVQVEVQGAVTQRTVLDALEAKYPVLKGAVRDYATQRRRPLLRLYACGEDFSNEDPDTPLPEVVAKGEQPYMIVGAIAGG
jgi:hypothetical protein